MTEFETLTRRELRNYLISIKQTRFETPLFESPVKTIPVDYMREGEELLPEASGVNEVYLEISSRDLKELDSDPHTFINNVITEPSKLIQDDDFTAAIVQFTGHRIFDTAEVTELVQILDKYFDLLICPLMSEQLDRTNLTANPELFQKFVENAERFIGEAKKCDVQAPILGTIPAINWKGLEDIIELYIKEDVDGFCIDFLGKKPTAKSRVRNFVCPLMRRLGEERLHRTSLMYAINAYRGDNRSKGPRSPAEDFFAFGLGFDILGGLRYRRSSGWGGDFERKFRCFYRDSYQQSYVGLDVLPSELPSYTGFDEEYLLSQVSDHAELARVQHLLEAEQMNLAANDLRAAITDGATKEFVDEKAGTTSNLRTVMKMARNQHDDGLSSPSLQSF